MKPRDLFRYGCTNLFRRKIRTILTALSMAVGVMCIVVSDMNRHTARASRPWAA